MRPTLARQAYMTAHVEDFSRLFPTPARPGRPASGRSDFPRICRRPYHLVKPHHRAPAHRSRQTPSPDRSGWYPVTGIDGGMVGRERLELPTLRLFSMHYMCDCNHVTGFRMDGQTPERLAKALCISCKLLGFPGCIVSL